MRKGLIYAIIVITFFLSCHKSEPLNPPYSDKAVIVITDRDYTPYLLTCFGESDNYIHIIMYMMKYYPLDSISGESQLLNAIIKAKERGVDVKVLLEKSDYNSSLNETNESTYVYLTSKGVNVRFDSPTVTTHAKLIVIDEKVAFLGSTNWSKSALEENNEVNVEIKDETIVKELESYFQSLWNNKTLQKSQGAQEDKQR